MPLIMIDYPEAAWNEQQLSDNLTRIGDQFQSPVFKQSTPFTRLSQVHWIELIRAVSDLVRQSLRAGKRIDFTEEVGTQGALQDITSLLDSMRQLAYVFPANVTAHPHLAILSPAINHVYGVGTGHFANGLFFHCDHEDEMAFFVGQDRIYFYRHLTRAFVEARRYLQSLPR